MMPNCSRPLGDYAVRLILVTKRSEINSPKKLVKFNWPCTSSNMLWCLTTSLSLAEGEINSQALEECRQPDEPNSEPCVLELQR